MLKCENSKRYQNDVNLNLYIVFVGRMSVASATRLVIKDCEKDGP